MRYAIMMLFLCGVLGFTGCGKNHSVSWVEDAAADLETGSRDMDAGGRTAGRQAVDIDSDTADKGSTAAGDDAADRKAVDAHIIYVDVCGEVLKPGVYCLEEAARACDAIAAAGGFTADAAREAVNQARVLSDGEQLYVPSLLEMQEKALASEQIEMSDGLVNINTAEEGELMTLPGIGKARAADIIAYRAEHGNFQKIEDLMQVPGIKEGLYQKLKDKIKI